MLYRVQQVRNDLAQRQISQAPLAGTSNPLDVPGVIYAIIHLPSSRIYIGQTINTAYTRFKQHWNSRTTEDFRNGCLHELMRKQELKNFIVLPIEYIDPLLYIKDGIKDHKLFRLAASYRENYWIQLLRTLAPKGLNKYIASKTGKNRRSKRPDRYNQRASENTSLNDIPQSNYAEIKNGLICINTQKGPDSHIRRTINHWLKFDDKERRQQIQKCSFKYRLKIRKWLHTNVQTKDLTDALAHVDLVIRELHTHEREDFPRTTKKDKDVEEFIKIVHSNEISEFTNIRSVLRKKDIASLIHSDSIPLICDKLLPPFSTFLCNFTKLSKQISSEVPVIPAPEDCPCRTILPRCQDFLDGHVCTTDYSIIPNKSVSEQFEFGAKYRFNMSPNSVIKAIQIGLNEYITKRLKNNTDSQLEQDLQLWKEKILNECQSNLNRNKHSFRKMRNESQRNHLYLNVLKNNFAITKVDKLSHNLALICKHVYQSKLYTEITSNAYSPSDLSLNDILITHKRFNDKYNYKHVDNLPYLYGIPKLHKNPPKLRYIAGVSSSLTPPPVSKNNSSDVLQNIHNKAKHQTMCSTTAASIHLSVILDNVIWWLRKKDHENYKKNGYRRCWIALSAEEVFYDLKQNQYLLKGRKPRTFDFTTMYTCLEHKKIFGNIESAVNEAITYQNLFRSNSSANVTNKVLPSLEHIMEHVRFIVSNTFLCNNSDMIKQQTTGIPMGTNAAPALANLTLYTDEANFIDELIAKEDIDTAKRYEYTYRFIDDILIWDVLPPPLEIYNLQYSEQTQPDGSVVFLGAKISIQENEWVRISVFDKTLEWNFPIVRYTHSFSNVPKHQSTGIFQGQLIRFRSICNSIKDFKIATSTLTVRMLQRGHLSSDISKAWNYYLMKFSNDKKTNYSKFRGWFRRMLHWALCNYDKKQKPNNNYPLNSQNIPNARNQTDTNQNILPTVDQPLAAQASSPVIQPPTPPRTPEPLPHSLPPLPHSPISPIHSLLLPPLSPIPPSLPHSLPPLPHSPPPLTHSLPLPPLSPLPPSTTHSLPPLPHSPPSTPIPLQPSSTLTQPRPYSSTLTRPARTYTRFHPLNTPFTSPNTFFPTSNNVLENSSDNQNTSSQESNQASSLDDDDESEMQPNDNLPLSKELFEQYLDDDELFAIRPQMMNILRSMESRHSLIIDNSMKTCNKCWQQFKQLRRHQNNDNTCRIVTDLRDIIISTKIQKIKRCISIDCTNMDPLFPCWCKIHHFCAPCHIARRNDSYSSTFLNCPKCGSSPALNFSNHLYSVPRVPNDCGVVALNHIINNLNGMNLPNENRSYINHDDMKSIITKSGGTWSYGNQYEIEDLMEVMRKMHIISYVPYITHPNGTTSVHIQTSTIGILVRPKRKNHFYCFIPSSFTNKRTWAVYDSLVRHMDGIQEDIILQLVGTFLDHQAEEAIVPFVLEQECDQPYCNDIDNYNLASQALPCNIHFACDYCFANKKIIFNEKNGIYHCSICADNIILFGR